MTRIIVYGIQLIDAFEMRSGVRQICLLPPFLFILSIDRVMKMLTNRERFTLWKR